MLLSHLPFLCCFWYEQSTSVETALNAEMSKSVPFLTKPKNLDGYVGNFEFDPLGFAELFDIKWLRESELKHGRASMLATVGFVFQEYYTLPGYEHVDVSTLAPAVVGAAPMLQIVFGLGLIEWWSNNGNITMENMFPTRPISPITANSSPSVHHWNQLKPDPAISPHFGGFPNLKGGEKVDELGGSSERRCEIDGYIADAHTLQLDLERYSQAGDFLYARTR